MNLEELLGTIRDLYMERYQEALDERKSDPGATIYLEPILLDEEGEPVREGKLDLPLRGDLFVADGGEMQGYAVDSTSMMDFDPFSFELDDGGTTFYIEPFVWDCLEVTFGGLDADETDWTPLTAWYLAWFDEEDLGDDEEGEAKDADRSGFAQAVHCLTDPEPTPEGACVSIDLGTAPVAAIEDLFAAIQMLGPSTCHLASANISDEEDGNESENGDGEGD